MKWQKGFTLIELLAVILLLGVIALIAIPIVSNKLKESKRDAFETTANNVVGAVGNKCSTQALKGDTLTTTYTFTNGEVSPTLNIKGTLPTTGTATVDSSCNVTLSVTNGKFTATKTVTEDRVTVIDGDEVEEIPPIIIVYDTTAPVITGATDITFYTTDTTFDVMTGVAVTDDSEEIISIDTTSNLTLGVAGTYTVTYTASDSAGNTTSITRTITILPIYTVYPNATAVYFNPVNGTKCTVGESVSTTETKTGCMKWYIFNDLATSSTVNMILDHNTTALVAWNYTTGKNLSGPYELLTQLKNDTSSWNGVPTRTDSYSLSNGTSNYTINYSTYKARLISAGEIAKITGNSWFVEKTTLNTSWFYFDSNNQTQTANTTGASNYDWLFDYTKICTGYGCNIADASTSGYWTSTALPSYPRGAWRVSKDGFLYLGNVESQTYFGVRPVITISKSFLS